MDTTGVKLTLGELYAFDSAGAIYSGGRRVIPKWTLIDCPDQLCRLRHGAYIVRYREVVRVPDDMAGLVLPRSSLLRMGATIYTAVWDPGYNGRGIGLLEVFNPHGISLGVGAHIGQLIYLRLEEPAKRPYNGVYQGEGIG